MISEHHMGYRSPSRSRLYRVGDGMLLGVCGGLADHFGIDRGLTRLVVVIAALVFFPTVVIGYLILGWLLDKSPDGEPIGAPRRRRRDRPVRAEERLERQQRRFQDLDHRLQRLEEYITSSRFKLDREFDKLRD